MDKDTYNQRLSELRRKRDNEEEKRKQDNAYYRERIRDAAKDPIRKMNYESEKRRCEMQHELQFERYKLEISMLKAQYAMEECRNKKR